MCSEHEEPIYCADSSQRNKAEKDWDYSGESLQQDSLPLFHFLSSLVVPELLLVSVLLTLHCFVDPNTKDSLSLDDEVVVEEEEGEGAEDCEDKEDALNGGCVDMGNGLLFLSFDLVVSDDFQIFLFLFCFLEQRLNEEVGG